MALRLVSSFDLSTIIGAAQASRATILEALAVGSDDAALVLLGEIRKRGSKSRIIGLFDNQPSAWRERSKTIKRKADLLEKKLGTTHPMGTTREEGATITPGKGTVRSGPRKGLKTRALTIPTEAARTRISRVARAGRATTRGGLDQFGRLRSRLWAPRGRRIFGALVDRFDRALFLLARSVKIGARPVMEPSAAATERDRKAAYVRALRKIPLVRAA